MKQFDSVSIKSRFLGTLSQSSQWSQVITDSAIDSLGTATSEPLAEVVRYNEYLLNEAKWKRAQNLSSMITGSTYLGYTPRRKVSSIGTLIVSHDPTLQQAGIANIFGVDDLSKYLTQYAGVHTTIPAGTIFALNDGTVQFISTMSVSYDPGVFYVPIPVIQGVVKSFSVTAKGNPFEQIRINSNLVEAANNNISAPYFSITATAPGALTPVPVSIVEDIFVADSTDLACSVSSASDYSSVLLTFGNGTAGALLTPGTTITINYLETLGSGGNVKINYTVNKIVTISVAQQFYCSNIPSTSNLLSGLLGGKDENTVDEIRGNAPVQYLINGAVVTTQAYKTAIENIPGVNTATVYSGTTVDPVSGVTTYSIIYSAVDTTGYAPDTVNFPIQVNAQLKGRNSPLDTVAYAPPLFLHLRTNIQAIASVSEQANISDLQTTIASDLANQYNILKQTFQQPFDRSKITSYVTKTYSVTNVEPLVEAIVDLSPSKFLPDPSFPGWYAQPFFFDRSFLRLKGFQDGVLHCLKINVVFDCAECAYNGNSYSRTLFLIQDVNLNSTYSGNFTVNTPVANGVNSIMSVCGQNLILNSASVATSITIASAVYTLGQSNSFLVANYTFALPSPGIVTITPKSTGIAPPSIVIPTNSSLTGVTVNFAPAINYKVVQYPLIENITSYNYMKNSVLNPSVVPNEILPGDTTWPYIPFIISFDYSSLNPADLDVVPLGAGTLRIPTFLPGTTSTNYINFGGASPTLLDTNIRVQVLAEPFNANITPYFQNNILKIVQDGVVDDVVVEVSNG